MRHSQCSPPKKKLKIDKSEACLCLMNPEHYICNPNSWKNILALPWIKPKYLKGNDSPQSIRTSEILLAILGPKFESESDVVQVNYPFKVVEALHDFAQNGTCSIDQTNFRPLLRAAHELKLKRIQQMVGDYMMTNLNLNTALGLLRISQNYLCEHFRQRLIDFIARNFDALRKHDVDFLSKCDPELFHELIQCNNLNVHEDDLFLVLCKWARLCQVNRQALLGLFNHLRFATTRPGFVESISDPEFFEVQFPDLSLTPVELSDLQTLIEKQLKKRGPKNYRIPNDVIFAIGGFAQSPIGCVETFDILTEKWNRIGENQQQCYGPVAYHGLAVIDTKIFLVGGYGRSQYRRSLFCFDLETLEWSKKSSMRLPRCYVSVTVLDGKIFAIGGFNGVIRTNTVECYDPKLNQWEQCAPMRLARSDASAFSFLGKVIVVGGFDGEDVLHSTEIYDPVKNTWTFGPRLNTPRSGLRAVTIDNRAYAIGGFDGNTRLNTIECLDITKPDAGWDILGHLITQRSNFGASVLVDKSSIIIAGGFNGEVVINEVEAYSVENNRSSAMPPLTMEKSALSLVTLSGLNNPLNYLKRTKPIF